MTVFFLSLESRIALHAAAESARAQPIPWEVLRHGLARNQDADTMTLADCEDVPRVPRDPQQVILARGWRVAITCEEQPAGLLLHVSMSSPAKDMVPTPQAMQMLVAACGYPPDDIARAWLEEYEPGKHAANVLVMLEPAPEPCQ